MRAASRVTLLAIALVTAFPPAQAQVYPNRPIHAVIGFAAGSGADIMCRWFTTKISELAGQTVVIDNKPGAFASIAHNVVDDPADFVVAVRARLVQVVVLQKHVRVVAVLNVVDAHDVEIPGVGAVAFAEDVRAQRHPARGRTRDTPRRTCRARPPSP